MATTCPIITVVVGSARAGSRYFSYSKNHTGGRCEPVWPSGKALGWYAEGPRFDTASALFSLQKGCGLWTLSCDFVHRFLLKR